MTSIGLVGGGLHLQQKKIHKKEITLNVPITPQLKGDFGSIMCGKQWRGPRTRLVLFCKAGPHTPRSSEAATQWAASYGHGTVTLPRGALLPQALAVCPSEAPPSLLGGQGVWQGAGVF